MAIEKDELAEILEVLDGHRGRQTELITVYVPAGYDVNSVQKQLEGEKSTAKNIKSTATRKNVTEALEKIVRHLKEFKKTPENGLAVFCGNVAKNEGEQDLELWSIEPPQPLRMRIYRCDKDFVLEALQEMLEADAIFGLVVLDRKEATIGFLEGKRIEVVQKMTSGIPGKVKAGGQSAQRFHRITEGLTKDFYKRIASEIKSAFYTNKKLKGLLVGGPIPTKDEFLDNEYLPTQLQEKVIGRIDLGDTTENGLKELVERGQEILADQEIIHEKKVLERFFKTLGEKRELAALKLEETKTALERGAVDVLVLSEGIDRAIMKELSAIAKDTGSTVEKVSLETEEGEQFKNLGGIGATLRFRYK